METIRIIDGSKKIAIFVYNDHLEYYANQRINIHEYIEYVKKLDITKGEDAILYSAQEETKKKSKVKVFFDGVLTVVTSLSALAMLAIATLDIVQASQVKQYEHITYTNTDIKNSIFSSPHLTADEKLFLCNDDFITDILDFINSDAYSKYITDYKLKNLRIVSYGETDSHYDTSNGYYDRMLAPNVLYIREYDGIIYNTEVVAHEFIHMCQEIGKYTTIIEACAEIISEEYYDAPVHSYLPQVKILKKLMETIGSYPIWHYNFTGDFTLIEEAVRPNLSASEYKELKECLKYNYNDDNVNMTNMVRLDELVSNIYKSIYGEDINGNEAIRAINRNDKTLKRAYFNKRLKEDTYYIGSEQLQEITFEEAMRMDLVRKYILEEIPLTEEEFKEMEDCTDCQKISRIESTSDNFVLLKAERDEEKTYITAIINDQKYENVDIDELIGKGLITIKYYLQTYKKLNYKEYIKVNKKEENKLRTKLHGEDYLSNNPNLSPELRLSYNYASNSYIIISWEKIPLQPVPENIGTQSKTK